MVFLYVLVVGVVATAALDAWQQVCRLAFGLPITDWGLIGRWVGHFKDGEFSHPDIARAPPIPNERPIGWLVHYAVGIGYAFSYLAFMWLVVGAPPSLVSALVFAALSVCVTWFFMEPVLGAGPMARNAPHRPAVLAHDFSSHLALGVGLWAGDLLARPLIGG